MNILTPTGYKPIEEIQVGDDVLAFDMVSGEVLTNVVEEKTLWDLENPDSQNFTGNFYRINDTWDLYEEQSIWRNDNQVVHIRELEIGDVVFDGNDQEFTITSIEPVTRPNWYRFEISGDHSYIVDNLTLHNASRFWVGGTGTWDNVTTTKWAATSGGAGGQSVPGSADTVTLNGASGGGTVTLNYAPTITSITGGAHTGTFDTGNNNMTMSGGFSWTGTATRTLTLGTSTITITGSASWDITVSTNLTFNGASSTIIKSAGQNSTFSSSGLTYGTVDISSNIRGTGNTYGTLTWTASLNAQTYMTTGSVHTVTGTCTIKGSSATNFGVISCASSGNQISRALGQYTINAASVSLSNIVFCDGVFGGAGTWSGTNVGDGGNNTGITFTTPVTRYWVATTGGNWASTTSWSATSGGASGASIPLPQDTIVFDANSITSGSRTITANHSCCGNVDFSNITNNPTLAWTVSNGTQYLMGDLTLKSGMTFNGSSTLYLYGSAIQTLTTNGVILANTNTNTITSSAVNAVLGDNVTHNSTGTITVHAGSFNANNKNISVAGFASSNNLTRSVLMGSGTWTLTGTGTVWTTTTTTNLTLTASTSTIIISDTSATGKTFAGGGATFNNVTFSGDNITVSGSNRWGTLALNNAGLSTGLLLTSGTTQTISSMTNNGTAGSLTKLLSTSAGSAATISDPSGIVSLEYASIKDSTATGGATFYAGNYSTNVSGNTGWIFKGARNITGVSSITGISSLTF